MIGSDRRLRSNPRGISSLYGAFAVVLVSTVVTGILLSASEPRGAPDGTDGRLTDLFLDTLLGSTVDANGTTLAQAAARACLRTACPSGDITVQDLGANLTKFAVPLSKALGRAYEFTLATDSGTLVGGGNLAAGASAVASAAQLYNAPSDEFLTLTLLLETR